MFENQRVNALHVKDLKDNIQVLINQKESLVHYLIEGLTGPFDVKSSNHKGSTSIIRSHLNYLSSLLGYAESLEEEIKTKTDLVMSFEACIGVAEE